jgi:oligopeptide/dipeptide ABC transporter ATP-binding protein
VLASRAERGADPMTTLISVQDLKKHFPLKRSLLSREPQRAVRAVDGVNLDLRQGEVLAIVGESGSGKTTLGMLLLGLLAPDGGIIRWSGRPLAQASSKGLQFRRDVQVIFQDPYGSLNPRLTVRSILSRPLKLHRVVPRAQIGQEVERLIELVGLRPARSYIDRFPHEFSGGQRQRIAIARALSLRPKVIIADEPVSALDVSVRAQILELLAALRRDFGIAILLTTHDLGVVRFLADRVAVMYLGKIVEIAPCEAFFRATHHPYSKMLLGSALSPNPGASLRHRESLIQGEPPSPIDPPSGCRFRTRCPHAAARCVAEEPLLRDVGSAHLSACHFDTGAAR